MAWIMESSALFVGCNGENKGPVNNGKHAQCPLFAYAPVTMRSIGLLVINTTHGSLRFSPSIMQSTLRLPVAEPLHQSRSQESQKS